MSTATNQQVQSFSDVKTRPLCELAETLYLKAKVFKSQVDDVYANLTNNPTWTDTRTDGVPHLAGPSDLLAVNTWVNDFISMYEANSQKAIVEKLVVRELL